MENLLKTFLNHLNVDDINKDEPELGSYLDVKSFLEKAEEFPEKEKRDFVLSLYFLASFLDDLSGYFNFHFSLNLVTQELSNLNNIN